MPKKKLKQFADIEVLDFVIEPSFETVWNNEFDLKDKWNESFFKNDLPLTVELGCGRGEYTIGLAENTPDENFIGVDIKGSRIWYGAKDVEGKELKNVGFLRAKVDLIKKLFGNNEVDHLWLTFSDPQPKRALKRLTSPVFIERYLNFLKPNGVIHLKTDSRLLFNYTLEEIERNGYQLLTHSFNLYRDITNYPEGKQKILSIKTYFEDLWKEKGYSINYLEFIPRRKNG
jgi:tRNA (guanine-N7-)-methyltransferase